MADLLSVAFKAVVQAMAHSDYYYHWVRMPQSSSPPPLNLLRNQRFNPYFKDCLGAIDRTLMPVKVSVEDNARYRTRMKTLSMNVLACCTFDLQFCPILAGWEGSAHDARVYQKALKLDMRIPQGRYFLADAGYSIRRVLSRHTEASDTI